FGFMPFYPGPGLGGHCIPIDPVYLSWKARAHGFEPRLIEVSQQINVKMPEHVVARIAAILNGAGKPLRGSRIQILGVAYKRDVSDTRESPAIDVMQHLLKQQAIISYSDPYVPRLREMDLDLEAQPLSALRQADCAVIITNHAAFDYRQIAREARLILDTRNALKGFKQQKIHGL
ncbi:MAG TPA: UDP binding domain-containing protein, partial [Terriglobales bacterium]